MTEAAAPARVEHRLDDAERRTLAALVRRVLPSDDGLGAEEAGCPDYVVQRVDNGLEPPILKRIRHGLSFLDGIARQQCGRPFAEASEEEQDRAFRQLQLTPHPTLQDFVHRVVNLTLRGFLCHPRHGGNRGRVGWRLLGIDLDDEPKTNGESDVRRPDHR